MSPDARLGLILTAISVIGGPTLVFVVRATVKWTRVEDRLGDLIGDVDKLVRDKDRVHREIVDQMREDRRATNERLTWLERHLWSRSSS